jgi:anthranilate phosphoribosyltransferase
LGPLANPAGATLQLLGVYKEELVEPLARVLSNLGVKRGMVVYGQDCIDEISLSAPTTVCELKDGTFTSYTITPEQFGFNRCKKEELVGGDAAENAQIIRDILDGKQGAKRDAVLLNAGAAIHIAKPEVSIEEGIKLAAEAIDSGKAKAQLEGFVAATNA